MTVELETARHAAKRLGIGWWVADEWALRSMTAGLPFPIKSLVDGRWQWVATPERWDALLTGLGHANRGRPRKPRIGLPGTAGG